MGLGVLSGSQQLDWALIRAVVERNEDKKRWS
jgi:hypothetical protein